MHRLLITAGLICIASASQVWGEGTFLEAFMAKYSIPVEHKFNTCSLCHVPGQPKSIRNPYGMDLAAKGAAVDINLALTRAEPLDSDLDIATNIAEILNGTWPGDPNDTTPTEELDWGRIKALYR